jgi:hypothetical protein
LRAGGSARGYKKEHREKDQRTYPVPLHHRFKLLEKKESEKEALATSNKNAGASAPALSQNVSPVRERETN